jgi:cytoskeletal protein CcmA (bactofilin family)
MRVMAWRWVWGWLLAGALGAAWADDAARKAEGRLGGDLFVAGSTVTVSEPTSGDLFAAGGSIDVDAPVGGDAVLAGGKLRLSADVAQSVYAAGGQVSLHGKVGRSVRVLGGELHLGPKAEVGGNVSMAGGQVTLRGTVKGHVQAGSGRVLIDGPVGGDVVAGAGELELGPNARIEGQLRWRSGNPIRQDPAAQVRGGISRIEMPASAARPRERERDWAPSAAGDGERGRPLAWLWTAGLVLLAAVLLAGLPHFHEGLSTTLRERPGLSLALGFAWLVCVPVAAVVLAITLLGIPLALIVLLAYLALLPLAYVGAGIGLGDWALRRLKAEAAGRLPWRIGATAAVLILLALAGRLPWVGGLLGLLVLLAGLGALLLHFSARWRAA